MMGRRRWLRGLVVLVVGAATAMAMEPLVSVAECPPPVDLAADASQQKKDDVAQLRVYTQLDEDSRVKRHYAQMRTHQTSDYVRRMTEKFGPMNHAKMTIRAAFAALESYVDASDPDMNLPSAFVNFICAPLLIIICRRRCARLYDC